ncbi:MAG: mannose-6-phosphate isomerase-like protein (cupin superfamily) [Parvicellaceae bacterium]|jgi:mannose-6-phosphate isomerase-like protein (cupin superfamily)
MESNLIKIFFVLLGLFPLIFFAQTNTIKDVNPDSTNFENIHVKKLSSDSLSTTFAIWIKLKVKLHKHVDHTEHVYIVEGKGEMTVGSDTIDIKKGDLITIPKDTWHGVKVTSKRTLKVISVQSPQFLGVDRVFKSMD